MPQKILLIGPEGERWIDEGQPFRFMPGERVAEDEKGSSIITPDEDEQELRVGVTNQGFQWGDAVEKLTKVFGIKPCSSCEKRRQILNAAKELGIKETLSKLKETF
mgnify:CR=1 FL=1